MALSTRQELIDYCLRRLGFPVIEINIDEDQINDRIDDAIQLWQEYHFDGVERTYVQHQITGSTLNLTTSDGATFTSTDTVTGGTSGATARVSSGDGTTITIEDTQGTFEAGETITGSDSGSTAILDTTPYVAGDMDNKYIPIGNGITGIIRLFNFGGAATSNTRDGNLFDLQYQFRQNDLYNLMGADMIYYSIVQSHLSTLDQLLVSSRQIRWNRKTNRLYIDTDWDKTFNPGDYVVAESYAILDPSEYSEVYDDMFLKKYSTALIKRQWGENMKKFGGIQLPGGVTLNGDKIFEEAITEINSIEDEMQSRYELPPSFYVG
tara:strand:- start:1391 stop:2356 length:966 start_codon:yes stop_codon:yes gene_type:complete